MDALPSSAKFVIIGAGVHGLSTAWHLAMELEKRGTGSGRDIVLLDRNGPGSGASGIACGCVRNLYMTEALHPILRHSVDVWMHDPVNFGFQQVGYVSVGGANQLADYERMTASQNAAGYRSDLYEGKDARRFLKNIWPDFRTDGCDVVLHERPSGYAGTRQAIRGLDMMCKRHGVTRCYNTEVTGYDMTGGRVSAVITDKGKISCEAVILGLGAWTPAHWEMLGHSPRMDVSYPDGSIYRDQDMWTYWRLLEGEVYTPDFMYRTDDGRDPPVLHVELMGTPVVDHTTGRILSDHLYVYWKNGAERMDRPGVQGGSIPVRIGPDAVTDPYGHDQSLYQADATFADYLCSAMGQVMTRFEGCRKHFRERPNGGIGAFTPDNVPIFDWINENVYMIADSNHGFKMLGVGKLVADHLASGRTVPELVPFTLSRFSSGKSFGNRNSNCPWV